MIVRWYHWGMALAAAGALNAGLLLQIGLTAPISIARSAGPQSIVLGGAYDAPEIQSEPPARKTARTPNTNTAPAPDKPEPVAHRASATTLKPIAPPRKPEPALAKSRTPAPTSAPAKPADRPANPQTHQPKRKIAAAGPQRATPRPAPVKVKRKTGARNKPKAPARRKGRARAPRSARLSVPGAAGLTTGSIEGNAALSSYRGQVLAQLKRHKNYPALARRAGVEGTAVVLFALARNGKVRFQRIVRPSGHARLDREVVRMVKAAAPFPAFPRTIKRAVIRFRVPVRFRLD